TPISLPAYPGPEWQIASTGDFNGDGHTDLLWRNTASGTAVVWFMDGPRRIAGASLEVAAYPDGWDVVESGDFNADGFDDILWRDQASGVVAAWFMRGTAQVGAAALTAATFPDPNWKISGTGDFNADGATD